MDSRESVKQPKIVEGLKNLDVEVRTEPLPYGDYYICGSEPVLVERKTSNDFVGSTKTRRLWEELDGLKRAQAKPLLLIEGSLHIVEELTDWSPSSVSGIMNSIIFSWQVPLIILPSRRWTVIYLAELAKSLVTPKTKVYPLRVKEKTEKLEDKIRFVVEGLPHISSSRGIKLLKAFKTVKGVINASLDELQKIEGIGGKIARDIYEVVNSEYEKNNQKIY